MPNCEPLVSIVSPSYNQGDYIEDTIRSVLLQVYPHVEHVVVDGGSTDQTLSVLQKYEDDIRWISEPDKGQADALNKGFDMVQGQIVGWVNSDDIYFDRQVISSAVAALSRHPEVGVVYGDFAEMDKTGNLVKVQPVPDFDPERLRRYNYIPQPSIFFRKEIADSYRLKLELEFVLDTEWMLRVAQQYQFRRIPRIQAVFRRHLASKLYTLGRERYRMEADQLHREYPFDPSWPRVFYRILDKALSLRLRILGWWKLQQLQRARVPYEEFLREKDLKGNQ